MTPVTATVLASLAFALVAIFVLAPLSSRIPGQLKRRWAREADEFVEFELSCCSPVSHALSHVQKALLACVAMLVGYALVATHGLHIETAAMALYFLSLLLLVAINIKALLLPDMVVIPTLWAGLVFYAYTGSATEHVYGAAAGYLLPFATVFAIKLITSGKEIMGHGDLKTMAMAGAWFGTAGLAQYFAGFLAGFVVWTIATLIKRKQMRAIVATGPAHMAGALAAAFYQFFA